MVCDLDYEREKAAKRKQIERVADAIKLLVPLSSMDCRLNEHGVVGWTEKGIANTRWPKSFTKEERQVIRAIAKTAISRL